MKRPAALLHYATGAAVYIKIIGDEIIVSFTFVKQKVKM
jgi:hypothetical protein